MNFFPSLGLKRQLDIKLYPFVTALLSLAAAYLLVLTPLNDAWLDHTYELHLIIESMCVFVSLGIFIVVLFTYGESAPYINPLCLGFILVAILQVFHIYYFTPFDLNSGDLSVLSYKTGFLGRLTKAIILLLIAYYPRKNQLKNPYIVFMTIIVSLLILTFILVLLWPVFYLEIYLIIAIIQTLTLVSTFFRKDTDVIILNPPLITFLILSNFSILVFLLFPINDYTAMLYSHIVKLVGFCFLFSAIIVTYISQPLKRMSENTELLNAILNMLPEGVIYYNSSGELSFINNKAEDILKIDKREISDQLATELASLNDDSDDKASDLIEIQEDNYGAYKLSHIKDAEGKSLNVLTRAKQVYGGKIIIVNDAKAHQRLKNMELQTKTILDSINSLVLMCDNHGKIVLCNKKLSETMGIKEEDLVGSNIRSFWKRLLSDHTVKVKNKSNKPKGFEEIILSSGDEKKILLYQKASIFGIDGEKVGTILVGSDITELRKQEDLVIKQEKLALLGQMGASIVHETKNYLTTIKGGSQLLERIAKDEPVKKIAKKIDYATNEVNRIIGGFLLLSRPKSSVYRETSLNELLESLLPLLETSTFMSNVKINLELCNNECNILCEQIQIKQVILNMAKNGVEAMSGLSNQLLRIKTSFLPEQRQMLVSIKDTGAGIAEDDIGKLDKPFFTTKEGGTGLGLNVSYRIIEEHGGRIEVESEPKIGTEFKIFLPCARAHGH